MLAAGFFAFVRSLVFGFRWLFDELTCRALSNQFMKGLCQVFGFHLFTRYLKIQGYQFSLDYAHTNTHAHTPVPTQTHTQFMLEFCFHLYTCSKKKTRMNWFLICQMFFFLLLLSSLAYDAFKNQFRLCLCQIFSSLYILTNCFDKLVYEFIRFVSEYFFSFHKLTNCFDEVSNLE